MRVNLTSGYLVMMRGSLETKSCSRELDKIFIFFFIGRDIVIVTE